MPTWRPQGTLAPWARSRWTRRHLAAGTSTGGMTNKRYGRVGDSPIIGAGTWADARCAVSGTGWGEYYIRTAAAHEICARMRYQGQTPEQAGKGVINQAIPQMGDGGAIVLGADGKWPRRSTPRACIGAGSAPTAFPMSQFRQRSTAGYRAITLRINGFATTCEKMEKR